MVHSVWSLQGNKAGGLRLVRIPAQRAQRETRCCSGSQSQIWAACWQWEGGECQRVSEMVVAHTGISW